MLRCGHAGPALLGIVLFIAGGCRHLEQRLERALEQMIAESLHFVVIYEDRYILLDGPSLAPAEEPAAKADESAALEIACREDWLGRSRPVSQLEDELLQLPRAGACIVLLLPVGEVAEHRTIMAIEETLQQCECECVELPAYKGTPWQPEHPQTQHAP